MSKTNTTKYRLAAAVIAQTGATASTTAAVEKSTPLMYALADKIMSFVDKEKENDLDPVAAQIQKVFAAFPQNDAWTARLVQLTEALTGFKPEVPSIGGKIGEVYIYGTVPYVLVSSGQTSYGVSAKGDSFCTLGFGPSYSNQKATIAQTGQFAKDILKVKGGAFIEYVGKVIGGNVASNLLKELGLLELL